MKKLILMTLCLVVVLVMVFASCTQNTPNSNVGSTGTTSSSIKSSSTSNMTIDDDSTTSEYESVSGDNSGADSSSTVDSTDSNNSTADGNTTTTTNKANGNTTTKATTPNQTTKPTTKATTKATTKPTTKAPTTTTKAPTGRTWKYESAMSDELFKLVNDYRASQGVAKLTYDSTCATGAKTRAEYNAKNEILSDHSFSQIGTGGNTKNSAQGLFDNWKNSTSHRQNMIETFFIKGGCAIYSDSNGYYYAIFQFSDGWD